MLEFASENGTVTCNGERVHIKGTNWFGLETDTFSLHGLWAVSFDSVLQFVKDNKFNSLRIPVSVELVQKMSTEKIKSINDTANPDLANMTIEEFLEHMLKKFAEAGILVMFDMHLLVASAPIPDLWHSEAVNEQQYIEAWLQLVRRYESHWNFFACDLNNEPHGCATWGDSTDCDWHAAAERIGNAILEICPRLLIFVEGIDGRDMDDSWWGGYLALAQPDKCPVKLSVPNRLVYSPHVYGPDVFFKEMFKRADFPGNLPAVWKRQWSFIRLDAFGPAVVIGEWGGKARPGTPDLIWQQALAEYLAAHDITDHFYWCINPNSGDTGGLLGDDWTTPNATKLEIINVACPNPTSFLNEEVHTPQVEPRDLPWPSVFSASGACAAAPADAGQPEAAAGAAAAEPAPPAAAGGGCGAAANAVFDPAGVCFAPTSGNSWQDAGVEHVQYDVQLTNNTGVALGDRLRVKVTGAELANIWTVEADGEGVYKLPGWQVQNGGLQPGASFSFGCIARNGQPVFESVCKE